MIIKIIFIRLYGNKKYLAEFLGTFFLVATVIGSGIMGDNLSAGNEAVALLGIRLQPEQFYM